MQRHCENCRERQRIKQYEEKSDHVCIYPEWKRILNDCRYQKVYPEFIIPVM
jgi:hypothetical protein